MSDTQAIAARLKALVAAAERLIAADDGSQEKADAIDALYLNFNYREIRADLAHAETLTQQVAELQRLADDRWHIIQRLTTQHNEWKAQAERAEQENARLTAEIDAAWFGIEHSYDIEPREQMEREAKTNGFKFGLAQAVHTIWKRAPKVQQAEQQRDTAHAALQTQKPMLMELRRRMKAGNHAAVSVPYHDGGLTPSYFRFTLAEVDAALAASAPQKEEK